MWRSSHFQNIQLVKMSSKQLSPDWREFISQGLGLLNSDIRYFPCQNKDVPAVGDCFIELLLASGSIPLNNVLSVRNSVTHFITHDKEGISLLEEIVKYHCTNPDKIIANLEGMGCWCGTE